MSCQPHKGSEEQLKADVDSFATYYYNWHFEKAARFCTPESKVWLRYAASNVHPADIELLKAKNEDAHIEIGDIDFKEDEVSATVNLEITNFLQMDTIGKEARLINKSKLTLPMTIHNGKWKVELKQLPTLQKQVCPSLFRKANLLQSENRNHGSTLDGRQTNVPFLIHKQD